MCIFRYRSYHTGCMIHTQTICRSHVLYWSWVHRIVKLQYMDCKDGLRLYYFIKEFLQADLPAQIYMGNQGAMFVANNSVTNKRSKHVDHRSHITGDKNNKGSIKLNHTSTCLTIMSISLPRPWTRLYTSSLPTSFSMTRRWHWSEWSILTPILRGVW